MIMINRNAKVLIILFMASILASCGNTTEHSNVDSNERNQLQSSIIENNDDKNKMSAKDTKYNDALDRFFTAVNALDVEAVLSTCFPSDKSKGDAGGAYYYYLTYNLGFTKGVLSTMDFMPDHELSELYITTYGFDSVDDFREATTINSNLTKAMGDFNVSYEIIDIKPLEKYAISKQPKAPLDETIEPVDIKEMIEKLTGVYPEEVNVIKSKIYWEYDGFKYGNDPKWWKNEYFCKKIPDVWDTYDKTIEYYDNMEYYIIVYEYSGKQYVYEKAMSTNTFHNFNIIEKE